MLRLAGTQAYFPLLRKLFLAIHLGAPASQKTGKTLLITKHSVKELFWSRLNYPAQFQRDNVVYVIDATSSIGAAAFPPSP